MTPPTPPRYPPAVEGGGSKTTAILIDLGGRAASRGFGPGNEAQLSGWVRQRQLAERFVRRSRSGC